MSHPPLLSVENLSVDIEMADSVYPILKDLTFEIRSGEVLGLVGESGSGKTMSALSLLGLLPPGAIIRSGSIIFEGASILPYDETYMKNFRGKQVGYVFQEPSRSFDPLQSIGSALYETLRLCTLQRDKDTLERESIRLLEELQIPRAGERLKNYPHQFSGGMLQRVMIALAIAQKPKLLIADEPTTALDVTIQAEVLHLLMSLRQRYQLSLLFISHNIVLMSGIADRIAVMHEGRIVECAERSQIINKPRHEYTQLLIENSLAMKDL